MPLLRVIGERNLSAVRTEERTLCASRGAAENSNLIAPFEMDACFETAALQHKRVSIMKYVSLIKSLYQIGAIQFGAFKLKSGQTSSIYINLRKIISYPDILIQVANSIADITQPCHYDLVCGVPYTALPIATCLSLNTGTPMIMRRKEKKDYGTKQTIEGEFKAGQTCLIIEDVITTGGSLIETADDLIQEGIQINDVAVLIDREQGGKQILEKKFKVHAIFTLSGMLNELLNGSIVKTHERPLIETFLHEQTNG